MTFIYQRRKKSHNRVVFTNYAWELIQHDSSLNKDSPYVEKNRIS
jgi:hypothetical protein